MTKFQIKQAEDFLSSQQIKPNTSSYQEYERAKSLLFPFLRKDPIPNLDYSRTITWLATYLRV